MLQFKYPVLEDGEWIRPILSAAGKMGSEFAFGTLFLWKDTYHSEVCRQGDDTYFCFGGPSHTYKSPVPGDGDYLRALETIIADAKEKDFRFRLWGIDADEKEFLEREQPGRFRFELDRDGSDYIYNTSDLIQLAGRKYHGKRNHIAQFEKTYDWSYEDLSSENLGACREVAEAWCKVHGCKDAQGFPSEPCALKKAFDHFDALHLAGGLIRIEGKPAAFTIGEEINSKVYLLHFEKALDDYEGLYPAINHEFAARHLSGYELVNREEDMGIEGLRKAKLSYHPAILLEKYIVTLAEETGDAAQ